MRLLTDLRRAQPETRRYLLGAALMGAAHAVPWTLLPLYLDRLGFSKAEIGSAQGAEAWGRAMIALPAAFLLARLRTTPVLAFTALLSAGCYALLPYFQDLGRIMGVNLLRGMMDQVHYVALAPFVFRHTSPVERPSLFALSQAVHTLMAVVGSSTCGLLVTWLTPRVGSEVLGMQWVLGATGLLPLAAVFVFRGIRETLKTQEERPRFGPTLRANRALVLRFALPQLTIATGAGLVIPFLGLYFQDRFGFSPGSVGTLNGAGQVLMTTGFLLSPWILRRLGFVRGVVAVEALSIPFFLVLAFTQSLPIAIGAFLLRGALMNTAHPIFKNFMMQAAPPGLREILNGVLGLLWGIGWVVGPYVGGRILDASGGDYTWVMCMTVVLYLMAGTASWILLRPVERRLGVAEVDERTREPEA